MSSTTDPGNGIIGQRIKTVRPMTDAESKSWDWDHGQEKATVIVLDNGICLFPSMDPEGNGPGALFGEDGEESFTLMAR